MLRHALGTSAGGALVTTLVVNAVGSAALAVLLYTNTPDLSSDWQLLLGTGVLASFTTYSTFIADVVSVSPILGLTYILGSYTTGVGGVLLAKAGLARLEVSGA